MALASISAPEVMPVLANLAGLGSIVPSRLAAIPTLLDFLALVRTCIDHAKSVCLTRAAMRVCLQAEAVAWVARVIALRATLALYVSLTHCALATWMALCALARFAQHTAAYAGRTGVAWHVRISTPTRASWNRSHTQLQASRNLIPNAWHAAWQLLRDLLGYDAIPDDCICDLNIIRPVNAPWLE